MSHSDRLELPFIASGQAFKHITHNQALQRLDALVQPVVVSTTMSAPPETPIAGAAYIVPTGASGAWSGKAGEIAVFQQGVWHFIPPVAGWQIFDLETGTLRILTVDGWQSVAAVGSGLPYLGVNATADEINRFTLASDATVLGHDGAGHVLKINKAGLEDTASVVFHAAWTAHAEMGLIEDSDWRLKVSDDGESWVDAITVNAATGDVSVAGVIKPATDNAITLGTSGARWSAVWSTTGTIQTSDMRLKTDIAPSALGLDFILGLKPVQYRWKEAGGDVESAEERRDTHFGFLAQEVAELVEEQGLRDFAGHVLADPADPASRQALRYTEFIAPLVRAVQELARTVETLERRV